jgi:hypothetical protein
MIFRTVHDYATSYATLLSHNQHGKSRFHNELNSSCCFSQDYSFGDLENIMISQVNVEELDSIELSIVPFDNDLVLRLERNNTKTMH